MDAIELRYLRDPSHELGLERGAPLREGYTLEEVIREDEHTVAFFEGQGGTWIANSLVMMQSRLRYLKELRDAQALNVSAVNDAAHRLISHTCPQCGKGFVPANAQAKFCSTNCRVAAHRKKQRGGGKNRARQATITF